MGKWRPLITTAVQHDERTVLLTLVDGEQHRVPAHQVKLRDGTGGHAVAMVAPAAWEGMQLAKRERALEPEAAPPVPKDLRCEPAPVGYSTTPHPWQEEALTQLMPLRVGGIEAKPGKGKTKVVVDMACARHRVGQVRDVLLLAPVNALHNIAAQIRQHQHRPQYAIHIFGAGTNADAVAHFAQQHPLALRWHLCGIESLGHGGKDLRFVEACEAVAGPHTLMVLDESDEFKGHTAQRTVHAEQLGARCGYRLVMSGTMTTESVLDLYSQMRFLDERILGERRRLTFEKKYVVFDRFGRPSGSKNLHVLAARIQPYVYTLNEERYPAQYRRLGTTLEPEQHAAYEEAKRTVLARHGFSTSSKHDMFRLYLHLQQIVAGYTKPFGAGGDVRLDRLLPAHRNPKLLLLLDLVRIASGQVLVWCKFTTEKNDAAALLREALGEQEVVVYSGAENGREKEQAKQRFMAGEAKVFLSLPSAAGRSHNGLQCAGEAIYLSNTFKNRHREQSEGRITRPPRVGMPLITDLYALKPGGGQTIDDVILRVLHRKQNVVDLLGEEIERMGGMEEHLKSV